MSSLKNGFYYSPPLDVPPMTCGNLGQFFIDELNKHGDKIFQLDAATGEKWTYAQTARITIRIIHQMRAEGISKGDIISLVVHNRMSLKPIVYAGLCLGATIYPVHYNYDEYEYYELFTSVQPKIIICEEYSEKKIRKVTSKIGSQAEFLVVERDFEWIEKMEFEGDDLEFRGEIFDSHNVDAFIYFSSGTTGAVKAMTYSHYYWYYSTLANYAYMPRISETAVMLSYAPMAWVSNMFYSSFTVLAGGVLVIATYVPEKHISVIKQCQVNWISGNPFYLTETIKSPEFDEKIGHQIKVALFGGVPSSKEQIDSFVQNFPNAIVHQHLGNTETLLIYLIFNAQTEFDLISKKRYSVGKLKNVYCAKLIDVVTKELITEKNKPGELLLKGNFLFNGYFNNEAATKAVVDLDGFFHTGDIFTVDEDDCFYFVTRTKDMIIYNHIELDVPRVESIIAKHPAVDQVCLVGKWDEKCYNLPTAFIIKKKGFESVQEEEIIQFVDERAEDYERLRGGVFFLDTFPVTASGKIQKGKLKNIFND